MPSFNGVAIFGYGVQCVTLDVVLERQENYYPGTVGVESLTLGSRGLHSIVTGRLVGTNPAALSNAEATFRTYRDGNTYTFVDSYGNSWSNVTLDSFTPKGKIVQDQLGRYWREYDARFRHLSLS